MLTKVVLGLILLSAAALVINVLPTGPGTPIVSAVPQAPHVFYGLVADEGGNPIPSGVSVEARINSVHYGQTLDSESHESILDTRTHGVDGDGFNYGTDIKFQVCADDNSTSSAIEGGVNDQEIVFYVNGILAVTNPAGPILYEVGGVQQVDLTIPSLNAPAAPDATSSDNACTTASGDVEEITPTPTPGSGGGSPPGGGGGPPGGGGGGGRPAPPPPVEPTPTNEERIEELTDDITRLDPEDAADELDDLSVDDATEVLKELDSERASEILENIRSSKVAELIKQLDSGQTAGIIEKLSSSKAASVIGELEDEEAATVFNSLTANKSIEIIGSLGSSAAARIIDKVDTAKASDIAKAMGSREASDVLGRVSPQKAGQIFEQLPSEQLEGIVEEMSEDRLIDRLPEMSVSKLMEIKPEVLFRRLPGVPVEQITFENTPKADIEDLEIVQVTPELAVYTVPQTGEYLWVKLVGSPVFIEHVLGKFRRSLSNVSTEVEELNAIPSGVPSLESGQVVNQMFRVEFDGAGPDDVVAVHASFYIAKSWMQENGIHKWAVQLNRFDEDLNIWVPFPVKRVGEDDNGIFYNVTIPGFSLFAISGSGQVTPSMFDVADLRVSPVLALSGEEVTISARVRNKSSRTAVYPANLWLNDTIEETRAVTIGAGETANVSFNVTKQPGDYRVRVERTLGEFSVSGQPAPTATPGPASPTEAPQPTSTPVPATAVPTRVVEPTSTPVPASPPPGVMASPTVVVAATGSPEPSATPPPTVAPQTPSATPTIALPTQPEEEGGIGVGAIIGIVAGIIVVLGAVISYMVVIQRRRV